jgi:hypothetical protein
MQNFSQNLRGRHHLEDVGVDGRITWKRFNLWFSRHVYRSMQEHTACIFRVE